MSRRILVVNPNTSEAVTEAYVKAARAVAPEGVVLTGVTGRFGARIVSMDAENIIAGHSALELVAEHLQAHDAVILAISFDTALGALRSLVSKPVVGITEAALRAAGAGERSVGVIFFGEVSRNLYEAVLAMHQIRPVAMIAVEVGSAADYLSPHAQDQKALEAGARLQQMGAEAIVICGAAIVGMAARLAPCLNVPVFDGTEAVAAALNALAVPDASRAGKVTPLAESMGLSPPLTDLLRGTL